MANYILELRFYNAFVKHLIDNGYDSTWSQKVGYYALAQAMLESKSFASNLFNKTNNATSMGWSQRGVTEGYVTNGTVDAGIYVNDDVAKTKHGMAMYSSVEYCACDLVEWLIEHDSDNASGLDFGSISSVDDYIEYVQANGYCDDDGSYQSQIEACYNKINFTYIKYNSVLAASFFTPLKYAWYALIIYLVYKLLKYVFPQLFNRKHS